MGTFSRGPLVYCFESVDNLGINLMKAVLDPASLKIGVLHPDLDGVYAIQGRTTEGERLTTIPYYLWGTGASHKCQFICG